MLAAGGIVALETMVDRLVEDIRRAKRFAAALVKIPGIVIDPASVESNIVMGDISPSGLDSLEFLRRLEVKGVQAHRFTENKVRFTFHRHIGDKEASQAVEAVTQVLRAKECI